MTGKQPSENYSREDLRERSNEFAIIEGRRPRLMVAAPDLDRGIEMSRISSHFADLGFDVDIAPPFSSIENLAMQALDNDLDFLLFLINKPFSINTVDELLSVFGHARAKDTVLILKSSDALPGEERYIKKGNGMIFGPKTGINQLAHHMLSTYGNRED